MTPPHHICFYIPDVDDSRPYKIRVNGHLDPRWAAWFDGLDLTNEDGGTTLIRGRLPDQAALHGLLNKLRDLGLPLVSVTQVAPEQPDVPTPKPRRLINPQEEKQ
jgi:hypothetical protein